MVIWKGHFASSEGLSWADKHWRVFVIKYVKVSNHSKNIPWHKVSSWNTLLRTKAKKLLPMVRMLNDNISFCGQYGHLTEKCGLWICSRLNQSWREVDFWIWYFCKDQVFVTPVCILLPIKHYIVLSWDPLINSSVLNPFMILSFGHNPLSSSGMWYNAPSYTLERVVF